MMEGVGLVVLYLLLFVSSFVYGQSIYKINDGVLGMPPGLDGWCRDYCNTPESCIGVFGDDHLDLQLKVGFSMLDGPGEHLLNGIGLGDTIARQSFETEFVLNIAHALGLSPCKIYVLNISPERQNDSWDVENVIITFRLYSTQVEKVKLLTQQAQDKDSLLYIGQVTKATDMMFGIKVLKWDYSLKLMTSIETIGGDIVMLFNNSKVLKQGSERWCEHITNIDTMYCEFETFFREDISRVLGFPASNVDVLFMKPSSEDAVIITFRFIPPKSSVFYNTSWVEFTASSLVHLLHDNDSNLYDGNVTFRLDPTWGLSGLSKTTRKTSKRLNRSVRTTSIRSYERCKETQRCSRGWTNFEYSNLTSQYTVQRFAGGRHISIPLFTDFEDWRQGTHGWRRSCHSQSPGNSCNVDNKKLRNFKPAGAHWSPFNFSSLGPSIPSFNTTTNSGLVLNAKRKMKDIAKQNEWIEEISQYLEWMERESNITSLDARTRSRKDILKEISVTQYEYEDMLVQEKEKLNILSNSQCVNACEILFNTSSLELRGTINATGRVGLTPDGTEVAIWAFDSIDLDSNVNVTLTGQRAMALISKSSANIDTSFIAQPGTLGGFPGGYSIFRLKEHRLVSVCKEIPILTRKGECAGDQAVSKMSSLNISNNVNGPGSPSLRFYSFTLRTKAKVIHEVQKITTDALPGQVIGGGFKLQFNGYETSFIRHDTSAKNLKAVIEDTLNAAELNSLGRIDRTSITPGVGRVAISRFVFGSSGGYEWRITFQTAVGNIGEVDSSPLTIKNLLTGKGATTEIENLINGNSIGGNFTLNLFNAETGPMDHDISADRMEEVLIKQIPEIVNANVSRSGGQINCNDGFCRDGPDPAGGYLWQIHITTKMDNVSPYSPTSLDHEIEGPIEKIRVQNNLTGCMLSTCPNVTVSLDRYTPFSLSYGGGGGSFGGEGGKGFSSVPIGETYGDKEISNLYGGSGGALGFSEPLDVHMIGLPAKVRGGSGGGAIEVVASTDLVLGSNSNLSFRGEPGWSGFMTAGGGGSGGSILLSAGGTVHIQGKMNVGGGNGGIPAQKGAHTGAGGGGGRIAVYGERIAINPGSTIDISGGDCDALSPTCKGSEGSLYKEHHISHKYAIDTATGAQETNSSLHLYASSHYEIENIEERIFQRHLMGPSYSFQYPTRPQRVSYYAKASRQLGVPTQGWGSSFVMKEFNEAPKMLETLGISFGTDMKHGPIAFERTLGVDNRQQMKTFHRNVEFDHWYKVDIRLNWANKSYGIYLDDCNVVQDEYLNITSIGEVSLVSYASNVDVWFDEIFAGNDTTMGFRCPSFRNDGEIEVTVGGERDWKQKDLGPQSNLHEMERHQSHISRRKVYSGPKKGGIVPYDGQGHRKFTSDIKHRSGTEFTGENKIAIRPGNFLRDMHENKPVHIWYGEHHVTGSPYEGGVGACSTQDFKKWRNEGIMIHSVNVTDMVNGSDGPFHIERPKVLYNNKTKMYVMWMIIENQNRSLALAGVATSEYDNGPFTFVRSFYPDGNRTRDQTLYQDDSGEAYLIRTFYDTIEILLPTPIMQPTWESVKNSDGSTNFALTYHRAHYEEGYDDFHDIYLQRWRGEDKPWEVICVDRITNTEREIPYGAEGDELCDGPFEYKKVIGQGSPHFEATKDGIRSRFLDPNDTKNNAWKPKSVPSVKAQSWKANYEAGACGLRRVNEDFQTYDPALATKDNTDRSDCSNIVDNPIHPTLPDKLQGRPRVVERRRAKFIAVSRLIDDYLDTSGVLTKYEGELEDGADLSFIVQRAKDSSSSSSSSSFEWTTSIGDNIQSTFSPQIHHKSFETSLDVDDRFHQFSSEETNNDKAHYSLQCIIDGNCPVNFRDQLW